MTDYSKMSDFEINSAVHNYNLSEPYSLSFLGGDRISWVEKNGNEIITDRVPYAKNGVHDYCNNPGDAWPIIVENFIAILPPENKRDINAAWVAYDDENSEVGKMDPNPLRAAMICFLMMKDAEK